MPLSRVQKVCRSYSRIQNWTFREHCAFLSLDGLSYADHVCRCFWPCEARQPQQEGSKGCLPCG